MENLKIFDFINYSFISNGEISKNKNNYAYIIANSNVENNSYNKNIYVYNIAKNMHNALTSSGKVASFQWVDNENIVFQYMSENKDESLLKIININGGESKELFKTTLEISDFKVISSNKLLLNCIYNINERDDTKDKNDYEVLDEIPFWSNGSGFTNKKRNRLYLLNLDKMSMEPITGEYTNIYNYDIYDNYVFIISAKFTNKLDLYTALDKYNIETSSTTRLIYQNCLSISKAFLHNNEVYIFATDMKKYGINENPALYKLENNQYKLLWDKDEVPGNNVNSDSRLGSGKNILLDNGFIYYTSLNRNRTQIKKLSLTGEESIVCELESIEFFDKLGDNFIVCGSKKLELQELYIVAENKIEKISRINTYFNNKKISDIEHVIYYNDSVDLDGFVIKPVDFDENKKYPCILNIHGGPKTAYGFNFFHEMQVWANEGYFVIFCNPRGSDGRGNEFADIRGKYGTIDYNDVMKFINVVIEKYTQIDATRVGVTGGSYGGFMTNWIIGHTDIFKAAVSQRSISNWISKFNTTDIGYYFNKDQIQATPWSDVNKLWDSSPVKYADKVNTPTLFIHSDQDYRCWIAEGLQMFTALKYHNVESRLCMFKGENHELSRSGKPLHRKRRLEEISNWFDKYLKR